MDDKQGTFKHLASLDTIPEEMFKNGPDPRGDGPAWGLDGKVYNSSFDAKQKGVETTVGPLYFRDLYQRELGDMLLMQRNGKHYQLCLDCLKNNRAYVIRAEDSILVGTLPNLAAGFSALGYFFIYQDGRLILRNNWVPAGSKSGDMKTLGINLGKVKLDLIYIFTYKKYMIIRTADNQFSYWTLLDMRKLQEICDSVKDNPASPAEKGTNPPCDDCSCGEQ